MNEIKRQLRPDSGLGFQVKVVKPFEGVPPLLERVYPATREGHDVQCIEGCLAANPEPSTPSPGRRVQRTSSQFKNNCLAEIWSGSEEGSY